MLPQFAQLEVTVRCAAAAPDGLGQGRHASPGAVRRGACLVVSGRSERGLHGAFDCGFDGCVLVAEFAFRFG
jgi:hypothetical protein